jgi:hypothetical protein
MMYCTHSNSAIVCFQTFRDSRRRQAPFSIIGLCRQRKRKKLQSYYYSTCISLCANADAVLAREIEEVAAAAAAAAASVAEEVSA